MTEANFGNTSLGFGIKIDLFETFVIRVSADEGFRAPNVWDLFGGVTQEYTRGAIDPLTFAYVPTAFIIVGPNPDLNPERSDNLSVGFEWRPLIAPGLTVTLDYSKINFQDVSRVALSWAGCYPWKSSAIFRSFLSGIRTRIN